MRRVAYHSAPHRVGENAVLSCRDVAGCTLVPRRERAWRLGLAWTVGLVLAIASSSAAQPAVRQVLLLNSFERNSSVHNVFAASFRTELSRQSPVPLNVFEVSLQPALSGDTPRDAPVVDYLLSAFAGHRLDLVVTLGGPAAAFARKHRQRLFPAAPLLLAAVDERLVQASPLSGRDAAVTVSIQPERGLEGILSLLPETTTVFVVIGASPLEDFWRQELARSTRRFEPRVTFVWSNDLSFADIKARAASLPPHSAVFYTLLSVDAKGVIQSEEQSLADLHAVANAPIFGLYEVQLGRGIVGGSLLSVDDTVRDTAGVAVRLLGGESPAGIRTPPRALGPPTFDWRELRRWNISEARLPAGSVVQFRQPTVWDQYKAYIVGAAVFVGLQSALIAGLVVQRVRRRRIELALRRSEQQYRATAQQNEDLAGRLITAQEAERTRIARDLHDDVSQQLAGVSIAVSGLKQRLGDYEISADLHQELANVQQQTLALARNVRHLSHDLHPTVLQHLGLVKGLSSYCGQLERDHGITIRCLAEGDFAAMSPEAGLCVYRIAQEALRNVIAHAGASRADVHLRHDGDHVDVTIADDGRGFDATGGVGRGTGLGLVSITERAKIAGGTLDIVTGLSAGTRVQARIPATGRTQGGPDQGTQGQVA